MSSLPGNNNLWIIWILDWMSLNRNHCVCNRNVYLYVQLCKELKRLLLILFKEIFVLFVLLLFWITEDVISFFFFIQSVFKNLKKKSRSQDGVARKHIYRSVSMYLLFCIMKKFHRKSHPPWAHFSFMILIWKKIVFTKILLSSEQRDDCTLNII